MWNIKTVASDIEFRWQILFYRREMFLQIIEMQLSKNQNFFITFLLSFWNAHHILNFLESKDEPQGSSNSEIIGSELCC